MATTGATKKILSPFYYIDGVTVNPFDNSNPAGVIQIKRPYPILTEGTDWDLAILRATYPMNAIPLGICPMLVGGASVNTTPFVVSITRNGTTYNQNVVWVPENKDAPVPTSTTVQDLSSKYYYYSTVATLLSCFNTALTTVATAAGCTNAPLITFDPYTSLFTLYFPQTDFGSTAITPSTLSWNLQTAQMFTNFASTSSGGITTILVPSTVSSVTLNGIVYSSLLQEAPNITAWDSLAYISMNTDLGIVPEDVAVSSTSVIGSSQLTQSQLTDIVCDSGTGQLLGGTRSGVVEYQPQSVPRWINMRISTFNSFNIFLNWVSKSGYTFPLTLPPGSQATMKLMFRHSSARGAPEIY